MASISTIIEKFILQHLADDNEIELSRNDLAKFFDCVPSQINYVLNTRFTVNRGYVTESVRGGSGYIKIYKICDDEHSYLSNILNLIGTEIDFNNANQILKSLLDRRLLTDGEYALCEKAISPKALHNPFNIENAVRANIMTEIVKQLLKGE